MQVDNSAHEITGDREVLCSGVSIDEFLKKDQGVPRVSGPRAGDDDGPHDA